MAERRRLSQPGIGRFLVDTRTYPDAGGSNQPEAPDHPGPEPNMDNATSNFQELVDFLKDNNEEVRNAYDRGGLNCKMTSPDIQKDLARCCAEEITEAIMEELGNRPFSVLIDESRDISVKEQMAVILRYVNSKGIVVERFLSLVHVKETTADALKEALLAILDRNKLSVSRIRGQGYDGASNMRDEFNGLQKKILDENPYAFYVHCFAHQLQLVVVSVANCCSFVHDFFEYIYL